MKILSACKGSMMVLMAALAIAISGCGQDETTADSKDTLAAAPKETIHIAYQYGIGYAPVAVAKEKRYLEQLLPDVEITWQIMNSGSTINAAIIAGDVDFAFMGTAPFITGITKGVPYKLFSGVSTHMPMGLVCADPAIKELKERIMPELNDEFAKKVGNFAARERFFNTPQEFTPIFFAEPRRSFFQKIFSTHPPLIQRIKALDPSFDGHFSIAVPKAIDEDKGYILELEKESTQEMKISSLDIKTLLPWCYIFDFKTADEILSTIPVETLEAISKPSISISLIFAILLEKYDQEIHKTQTGYILTAYDLTVLKDTQRLYVFVYELNRTQKLLLASISIASLKEMNKTQFKIFNSVIKQIISADKKINLLEFCLVKTIKNTLASRLSTTIKKIRNRHLNDFPNECAILLSILARAETDKEDEVQKAFDAGVKELNLSNSLQLVSRDVISNKGLGEVMDKLDSLTEKDRLSLYCACGTVVNSNHRLCEEEADLMRILQSALQVN